ncbi:DDE-type integrase/transposase/recombinase, partial [Salmonella enterica subsp. enterica serovar Enteritidis]|nr:DDE-type integrase/transposase/recombinase [Salmonella enterica subsp. enterica serovar Enteritidis]
MTSLKTSIKTITYLSDIGCLEIHGASLRNNVIECDHGKLKRIINATLGFKSMKTAYATIKGIEV